MSLSTRMGSSILRNARSGVREGLTYARALGLRGASQAWRYWSAGLFEPASDEVHLRAALDWLCLAQDATGNDGVSSVYRLRDGWDLAYPETTGYILATFLSAADMLDRPDLRARAEAMGAWECGIQTESGGVLSSIGQPQTRVFNTGQVVLGWCALRDGDGDRRFLDAAVKAGNYLVTTQEGDGRWVKDTYCGARTYHARVDWSLIRLWRLSGQRTFLESALRNLRWVLAQQEASGWFANCGFGSELPITHVIGYTLRGLVESWALLRREGERDLVDDLAEAVARAADGFCSALRQPGVGGVPGMLPERFTSTWDGAGDASCLTGNVQLALVLLRLARQLDEPRYAEAADSLIDATKRAQVVRSVRPETRGALPGSYPMHRGYLAMAYPNWATKFLADALLARIGGHERIPLA